MRLSGLVFLFASICLGCGLFLTSQSVQRVETALRDVENNIEAETENVRVLSTEWVYLNKPQRLEVLAQEYLRVERGASQFVRSDFNWERFYFENNMKEPPRPAVKPIIGNAVPLRNEVDDMGDLLQRVMVGGM